MKVTQFKFIGQSQMCTVFETANEHSSSNSNLFYCYIETVTLIGIYPAAG